MRDNDLVKYNDLDKIQIRLNELDQIVETTNSLETVEKCTDERKELIAIKTEIEKEMEAHLNRKQIAEAMTRGTIQGRTIERQGDFMDFKNIEENKDLEVRALQKFLTGGMKTLTEVEERALTVSGSAAAIPVTIQNQLITSGKYSDLLNRARVFTEQHNGKLYIPIASNTAASWKIENSNVDGSSATYEATPTLTKIELGGYELYRWSRISAASYNLATAEFQEMLLGLLAAEVVETLEKAFISGTGTDQPKGLDELTWSDNTNAILTASAATAIGPADIAEAISLLPQKYARNAVILVNANMLYNISQFKGTQEYAFDMADGATRFLGKEIVVSEHMLDDTVYIVDPKELYIRFE